MDHGPLYELAMAGEINYLWRFRGSTPSYEQFVESLQPGVLCQFVVAPKDGEEILGMVVGYNADMRNRFCYGAACLSAEVTHSGIGIEAFVLFTKYLFHCWEFRKIYIEASELNYSQYRSGEALGVFSVEGRLSDHMYMAGRFWDQYVLAIHRRDFDKLLEASFGRLFD